MNPMDMLKNLQDMQGKMAEMQEKLKDVTARGSSGGDMVSVTLNGKLEALDVVIAPELVTSGDVEMLEDLVLAAMNSALRELQDELKAKASDLTGGLPLPGGFPGM